MKNYFYCFVSLLILTLSSCSDESNELNDPNATPIEEIKVILPDQTSFIIKKSQNEFIADSNYNIYLDFLDDNKGIVIGDFEDGIIRLFYNLEDTKDYLRRERTETTYPNESNQKLCCISGEIILYDGMNNTGNNISLRMSADPGRKPTHQLPFLDLAFQQYNYDGTYTGSLVNMDNKIASIKIIRDGLVILYEDEWFNNDNFLSRYYAFSNRYSPGSDIQRSINLPTSYNETFNYDNIMSSVYATVNF